LDLVERGHRLVVDDLVLITRKSEEVLIGAGNDIIQHYLEIRGLGIIDVKNMFGIRAIRQQKRIEVEVLLEDWDASEDYERLGLEEHKTEILGVKIPQIHLPIFPGKNITVIVETIALNTLLQIFGISAAREFDQQLLNALAKRKTDKEKRKVKLKEYFEHDIE
jgi:HPr kinase/phosphorylase